AVHCSTVGNAVSDILGSQFRGRDYAPFWRWTFVFAGYTAILTEVLRVHEDEAFPGAFLRNTALLLFRAYEPDLALKARQHAAGWRRPASLLPAFEADGGPGSLPGLVLRALAAARRHGFAGPLGPAIPARFVPEREPILDAYYDRQGGADGVYANFRGMLA